MFELPESGDVTLFGGKAVKRFGEGGVFIPGAESPVRHPEWSAAQSKDLFPTPTFFLFFIFYYFFCLLPFVFCHKEAVIWNNAVLDSGSSPGMTV